MSLGMQVVVFPCQSMSVMDRLLSWSMESAEQHKGASIVLDVKGKIQVSLPFCRMILETDGNAIAGKVATSSVDPAAPLSEQVMRLTFASIFFLTPPPSGGKKEKSRHYGLSLFIHTVCYIHML